MLHVGSLYRSLMSANYVPTQSVLVRRSLAGDDLHFAEDVPTYEEWECFARLARRGPVAFMNCETFIQWGHKAPRLTDAGNYELASAQLAILARVWGQDARFLREYPGSYENRVRELHRIRANALAHKGRRREARQELRQAGRVPLKDRLLTSMPSVFVVALDTIRDFILGV
jgi:hypothetical protein